MPSPYSEDFRQKVIAAVERGEGKTKVARMMNISRNTLGLMAKTQVRSWQLSCHHPLSTGLSS